MSDAGAGSLTRSWRGGRGFPLAWAVLVALIFGEFTHWRFASAASIMGPGTVAIFAIVFLLTLLTALRRKATLTSDTLVLHRTFHTDRLPLREITMVRMGKPSRTSFTESCVTVTMADRRVLRSMAFGLRPAAAVEAVSNAVRANGGQLQAPQHRN